MELYQIHRYHYAAEDDDIDILQLIEYVCRENQAFVKDQPEYVIEREVVKAK